MSTKSVIKLIVRQLPSISRAAFLSWAVAAAHAGPLNCEDWNEDTPNKVALARVVTTQKRLHFIAGRDKRRPACPPSRERLQVKSIPRARRRGPCERNRTRSLYLRNLQDTKRHPNEGVLATRGAPGGLAGAGACSTMGGQVAPRLRG